MPIGWSLQVLSVDKRQSCRSWRMLLQLLAGRCCKLMQSCVADALSDPRTDSTCQLRSRGSNPQVSTSRASHSGQAPDGIFKSRGLNNWGSKSLGKFGPVYFQLISGII